MILNMITDFTLFNRMKITVLELGLTRLGLIFSPPELRKEILVLTKMVKL